MQKRAFLTCILFVLWTAGSLALAGEVNTCHSCGQPIDGAYFQTNGIYYHPGHFLCAHCREPITRSYTTFKSLDYHNECFRNHIALRCTVCDQVIGGEYLHDYWGNSYHTEHQEDVPSCDFCARFATEDLVEGGVFFSDGRFLCRLCHTSAVKSLDEVKRLGVEAAQRLRPLGIDVKVDDVRWHLIGVDKMHSMVRTHAHGVRGFTDYEVERNIFRRVVRRRIDIYLLYGMPRLEMLGTITHELTHVWQFQKGRLSQDPVVAEGSCNYAAYLVLREIDDDNVPFLLSNMEGDTDPIYGDGFRRVKRYAEANGLKAWRKLLASRRPQLP